MQNNLLLKFIVIIFSILLWYQLVLMQEQVSEIEVPIKLLNLSEDLIFDESSKQTFPIKIRANGMDLLFFKLSNSYFEIDASNLKYGKNFIKLDDYMLHYSERVDLEVISIDNTNRHIINIDKIITSFKPINIIYASQKDQEYFVKNKIITGKNKIELTGPKSIIDTLKSIDTEPANRKDVKDGKISLKLTSKFDYIGMDKDFINLQVSRTQTVIRTISLIPISYPEDENITIIPQKVSIMVSGPKEIVNKLNKHSISATLDYNKLLNNKTAKVNFQLPVGVNLLEYTPNRIQIIEND